MSIKCLINNVRKCFALSFRTNAYWRIQFKALNETKNSIISSKIIAPNSHSKIITVCLRCNDMDEVGCTGCMCIGLNTKRLVIMKCMINSHFINSYQVQRLCLLFISLKLAQLTACQRKFSDSGHLRCSELLWASIINKENEF